MKKKHLLWIIPICFFTGLIFGIRLYAFGDYILLDEYDLYNCIYDNAEDNDFPKSPYLVEKIQDECVCFREHNYTNLLEAEC